VFIVHATQESQAYATIVWDNLFFNENRIAFAVSHQVSWLKMEWALSAKFYHQTGCCLSRQHLNHLCK
jgi:signal transducer and activator of transcription 5B